MRKLAFFLLIAGVITFAFCRRPVIKGSPLNDQGLLTIVTSPAGTNSWQRANPKTGEFTSVRKIDFLPLPVNVAYVPKTRDPKGTGDYLETMILAEHQEVGTIIRVKPIGVLYRQGDHPMLLAIPVDSTKAIIKPNGFRDFMIEYATVRSSLEFWLERSPGITERRDLEWRDERAAGSVLKDWLVE